MMDQCTVQFWQAIRDAIEKFYPNIGGIILEYEEDEGCQGFILKSYCDQVTIQPVGVYREVMHDVLDVDMMQYQDPPGTFEGMPNDCKE